MVEPSVGEKYMGEKYMGEKLVGEKPVGKEYMGEKSVGEKSLGENRGRWDAGFRSPFSGIFKSSRSDVCKHYREFVNKSNNAVLEALLEATTFLKS